MKIAILLPLKAYLPLWRKNCKFNPKQQIAPQAWFFPVGTIDGLNRVIFHQYLRFKKIFPDTYKLTGFTWHLLMAGAVFLKFTRGRKNGIIHG